MTQNRREKGVCVHPVTGRRGGAIPYHAEPRDESVVLAGLIVGFIALSSRVNGGLVQGHGRLDLVGNLV